MENKREKKKWPRVVIAVVAFLLFIAVALLSTWLKKGGLYGVSLSNNIKRNIRLTALTRYNDIFRSYNAIPAILSLLLMLLPVLYCCLSDAHSNSRKQMLVFLGASLLLWCTEAVGNGLFIPMYWNHFLPPWLLVIDLLPFLMHILVLLILMIGIWKKDEKTLKRCFVIALFAAFLSIVCSAVLPTLNSMYNLIESAKAKGHSMPRIDFFYGLKRQWAGNLLYEASLWPVEYACPFIVYALIAKMPIEGAKKKGITNKIKQAQDRARANSKYSYLEEYKQNRNK